MKDNNKIIVLVIIAIVAVIGILLIQKFSDDKVFFKELNYKELTKKIEDKDSFLLLIKKDDCAYCDLFFPKIEKIINENKVEKAYYINTSNLSEKEYEELGSLIKYNGTPTTVFFDKGTEMDLWTRIDGNQTTKYIKNRLIKLNYLKEE